MPEYAGNVSKQTVGSRLVIGDARDGSGEGGTVGKIEQSTSHQRQRGQDESIIVHCNFHRKGRNCRTKTEVESVRLAIIQSQGQGGMVARVVSK